jgi:hypothetical protein
MYIYIYMIYTHTRQDCDQTPKEGREEERRLLHPLEKEEKKKAEGREDERRKEAKKKAGCSILLCMRP